MNKYYIEIRPLHTYIDLTGKVNKIVGSVIESYPRNEFEWENNILPQEIYNLDKEKYAIYKSERI